MIYIALIADPKVQCRIYVAGEGYRGSTLIYRSSRTIELRIIIASTFYGVSQIPQFSG